MKRLLAGGLTALILLATAAPMRAETPGRSGPVGQRDSLDQMPATGLGPGGALPLLSCDDPIGWSVPSRMACGGGGRTPIESPIGPALLR